MLKNVEIFIDGSSIGNPGPGGFGAILRDKYHEQEISAGYILTTNNRMELMAAIIAIELLKSPSKVEIITDSQYVLKGMTHWIYNWKKQGWRTSDKKVVKNIDLWQRLDLDIKSHGCCIGWHWVKGHMYHEENNRCDVLARSAAKNPTYCDTGYKP